MKKSLLLALSMLSGCAVQGVNTLKYADSKFEPIKNEIQINEPYLKVWDALVRDLAKSFYIINNIDKESRIINVSFSSTEPVDFVDCGKSTRTYSEGSKEEKFEYELAASSIYKFATPQQEDPAFNNYVMINREPILEGRSNIYIAPVDSDSTKTSISVNSRYILTIKAKGQIYAKHISGRVFTRGSIPEETSTWSFNTNEVVKKDLGGGVIVTCFSKGKLEKDILGILQGNKSL